MGLYNDGDFRSKYELGVEIGRGNFAVVREARDVETGKKVAVKIMVIPNAVEYKHVKKEIEILGKLDHDSIVRALEIYETLTARGKTKVYIVMELVTGGELFDHIVAKKKFNEGQARAIIKSVLEALVYARSQGVVHRDLKPENILLASPDPDSPVKIADWGLSRLYIPNGGDAETEAMMTMCGTPGYVAPEVLEKKGYGFECDVWSAGVILYVMLCGFLPFQSKDRSRLFEKIKEGTFRFPSPYWDKVSDDAKAFVRRLLTVDVNKRISAKDALNDEWMQSSTAGDSIDVVKHESYQTLSHARKKWHLWVNTIVALNRMKSIAGK